MILNNFLLDIVYKKKTETTSSGAASERHKLRI